MKSFDEWLKEKGQPASNFLRREAFEAGQQSKQAEVDELRRRIDEALYYLDFNHDNDKDIAINILKGDQS